jgi:hypothetical protein
MMGGDRQHINGVEFALVSKNIRENEETSDGAMPRL